MFYVTLTLQTFIWLDYLGGFVFFEMCVADLIRCALLCARSLSLSRVAFYVDA